MNTLKPRFNAFYVLSFIVLLISAICMSSSLTASADEEEMPIVVFELETEDGLFYGKEASGKDWHYDGESTLTFDNFSRKDDTSAGKKVIPNITINARDQVFNLVLKGDNYWPGEIWIDYGTLKISGEGTLKVKNNILINRTSYYTYDDGSTLKLPENDINNGTLTFDNLYIVGTDNKVVDIASLPLIEDGLQHYDIPGPSQIVSSDKLAGTLKKAKIKSVTSPSKKRLTVKVNNNQSVDGYEITLATDKAFENIIRTVNISGTKAVLSKKLTKLTSGQKYYVKVRAFNILPDGEKLYGKYSSVKYRTVK